MSETYEDYAVYKKEQRRAIEPKRMLYAIDRLSQKGFTPVVHGSYIEFEYKGSIVKFFPYTGWATGKTIKDGRGINNLIKQLK